MTKKDGWQNLRHKSRPFSPGSVRQIQEVELDPVLRLYLRSGRWQAHPANKKPASKAGLKVQRHAGQQAGLIYWFFFSEEGGGVLLSAP